MFLATVELEESAAALAARLKVPPPISFFDFLKEPLIVDGKQIHEPQVPRPPRTEQRAFYVCTHLTNDKDGNVTDHAPSGMRGWCRKNKWWASAKHLDLNIPTTCRVCNLTCYPVNREAIYGVGYFRCSDCRTVWLYPSEYDDHEKCYITTRRRCHACNKVIPPISVAHRKTAREWESVTLDYQAKLMEYNLLRDEAYTDLVHAWIDAHKAGAPVSDTNEPVLSKSFSLSSAR